MHRSQRMAVTGILVSAILIVASSATAQVKTLTLQSMTAMVTIEGIDQATRTITVKDEKGVHETITIPPAIQRFAEMKVGDRIVARYYQNIVIRMKKAGEPAIDLQSEAATRGEGARPAGTAATQRTMTVTVTAKDPADLSVTVMGPNGYVYNRRVADKDAFALLNVGDRLDMTWTDAVLVSVETAEK